MRFISLAAAAALAAALVTQAFAEPAKAPPMRIRGTVEKVEGTSVIVKSRDGADLTIALPADGKVATLLNATLADVKEGEFIGSAAVKGADGKLHAQEVLIFPEAMRGANEGHYAWDLTPDSTMTNANVTEVETAASGAVLKLKHKDGDTEIDVPSTTKIVRFGPPGNAALLVPGAAVFVVATTGEDGKLTARFVVAEKDGVKPPM